MGSLNHQLVMLLGARVANADQLASLFVHHDNPVGGGTAIFCVATTILGGAWTRSSAHGYTFAGVAIIRSLSEFATRRPRRSMPRLHVWAQAALFEMCLGLMLASLN